MQKLTNLSAVLFDLDGVLVESEPHLIAGEIEVLRAHGIPLTEEVAGEYLGLKLPDYISALAQRYARDLDIDKVVREVELKNEALYRAGIPLVHGVQEVLELVSSLYSIALVTSRERALAHSALQYNAIDTYFLHGIYKEDVTRGKPDPEGFLKAAALLQVAPDACVVIEDAENGFKAARAAGMQVVARKATHNKNQDFSTATVVIKDMKELMPIIT